jgi:hypothetical protein
MNCSRFGVLALASVVCLSLSVADASAQRRGGGGGGGRSGGGGGGGGRAVARPGPSGGGTVGRAVPRGGRAVVAAPRGGYYGGRYYRPYYGYGYGRPYYYPRAYYGYGLPYYRYPAFSFGFSVGVGYPYGYGYYGSAYGYPYYGYGYPYYYPSSYGYPPAGYVSTGYPGGYAYGSVKIQDAPHDAQVFVDGTYAGIVDDFDGAFQSLDLQSGAHQVEVRIPGRPPLHYDVNVQPGQTLQIHVR